MDIRNIIRQKIRKQINILFENISINEVDPNLTHDAKQMSMARKMMGDDSIIVLNKLQFGEKLTRSEQNEARDKYLGEYILAKAKLSGTRKLINPINTRDLEEIFDRDGHILDAYLKELVNVNSSVEQISDLERSALLNISDIDTPFNASDSIAKKYIIKMLVNLDIPQSGDNKWTTSDSIEANKAYQIALTDNEFRGILEKVLSQKGKKNTRLYRKLIDINQEQPMAPSPVQAPALSEI